jgi:hypothetical protein
MNIGTSSYFLQSADYVEGTSGARIDLDTGTIRAHSFNLAAGNKTSSGVFIDSSGPEYFYAGTPLSHIQLTSSGLTVKTTNFTVDTSGNIFAKSGTIGGWHLHNNKLYAGGIIGEINTGY